MHPKRTHPIQLNLPLTTGSYPHAVRRKPVIAMMLKALALLLTIALSLTSTAIAKPKGSAGGTGGKAFNKIVDVDAVSITISIGTDGNSHQRYSITDSTKVTLNGAPANARDLRDGMVAHIDLNADGKTADTITAKDPPAHPERHRTG